MVCIKVSQIGVLRKKPVYLRKNTAKMTTNTQKMGIFVLVRGQAIQSIRDSWSVALTDPMKRGLKVLPLKRGLKVNVEGEENVCS